MKGVIMNKDDDKMSKAETLIGFFLVIFFILGSMYGCLWIDCKIDGSNLEREVKFTVYSGCLVKSGNGYVPLKNLRGVE